MKISEYNPITFINGDERLLAVQNGVTKTIPTNMLSRLSSVGISSWVNVKDYGAVGDGITDDTVAIQNAINYASTINGTVIFPAKNYLVSIGLREESGSYDALVLKNNVTLFLNDSTITLSPNGEPRTSVVQIHRHNNVKVIGGKIVGDRYSHIGEPDVGNHSCLNVSHSTNVLIKDCTFTNSHGDGCSTSTISMYLQECVVTEGSPTITFVNTGQNAIRSPYIEVGFELYKNSLFPNGTRVLEIGNGTITFTNNAISSSASAVFIFNYPISQNIVFENILNIGNRRNGMVVESGRGISVINCAFVDTANGADGVAPGAGVDVEPYYGNTFLRDVYFRGCTFERNAMGGFFGQNCDYLVIEDCHISGEGIMCRGSKNVMITNCILSYASLKYSEAKITGCKFINGGIAIYNESTLFRDLDVEISENSFVANNESTSQFRVLTLFNIGSDINYYNKLIFRNNTIGLDNQTLSVGAIFGTDQKTPSLFNYIEFVNNTIIMDYNLCSGTQSVIISYLPNNRSAVISGNIFKIKVNTLYTYDDISLLLLRSGGYVQIKNNTIMIMNKAPINIFKVENTTEGSALYDIKDNDVICLGSYTPTSVVKIGTLNGSPTVRSSNNTLDGVVV